MGSPPPLTNLPWRPWLGRVALNSGRDLLRGRRRQGYVGPWLPSPIDTGDEASPPSVKPVIAGEQTTEGRYDLLESVSFAFLLALEALSPLQRAVLLLRDVFDYSVRDTAEALEISTANVKTTHHRARAAMAAYDQRRCVPGRELQERTRMALATFLTALQSGDVRSVESMLAESVRALSDGGGEFHAARIPVLGRAKVARFCIKIFQRRGDGAQSDIRMLNGLPALVTRFHDGARNEAARVVTRLDIDADGKVVALHSVLTRRKLTAV